jgi:DNA-directed RNA polymerase specialized sigma24 family protein
VEVEFVYEELKRLAADVVSRLDDARLLTNREKALPLVEDVLSRGLRELAEVTAPTVKERVSRALQDMLARELRNALGGSSLADCFHQFEREQLERELSPQQLEILRLLEIERLQLREAADRMGMKLDNLNDHLRRGARKGANGSIRKLRERYREAFAEVGSSTTQM